MPIKKSVSQKIMFKPHMKFLLPENILYDDRNSLRQKSYKKF